MTRPDPITLPFAEITSDDLPRVGGKGMNLGALTRAGISVPPGYCVTTVAYRRFLAALPDADARFAALDALGGADVGAARAAAEGMRAALETLSIPEDVAAAVVSAWKTLGPEHPLAVRSSATAEDLPGASFAGQQDTYLNVVGEAALLDAVRRCWISLFTDRAVLYRARGGFGHRGVSLSVVVQRLVDPDVSGILFTADPVSGHRGVASIDAGFGLGEALVGGLISADLYQVDRRTRKILVARPGDKEFAIRSVPGGGTRRDPLPEAQRKARALDDAQVLALVDLGDRVEAHYGGAPQDIEWCIEGGKIHLVQARPITSLFPVPVATPPRDGLRIFASFGHFQMMTDAMPRLAREVWRMFLPAAKNGAPTLDDPPELSPVMVEAGSRLFLDVTAILRVPQTRAVMRGVGGVVYPELVRLIEILAARPEVAEVEGATFGPLLRAAAKIVGPVVGRFPVVLLLLDPVEAAEEADQAFTALQAEARARIAAAPTSGARIRQAMVEVSSLFGMVRGPLSRIMSGVLSYRLLAKAAAGDWADDVRDDVDRLLRGLPGNVTTQMDLAVGDLTDLVRSHPDLAGLLRDRPWREIRPLLTTVKGGTAFLAALDAFLTRYGDRGAGEIDISRPRWKDDPSLLFRVITGGLAAGEIGEHRRRHQRQVEEGEAAMRRLVDAAGRGSGGPILQWWVSRLCQVVRSCMGLREHPKFTGVRILGLVRTEVLEAGETLSSRGQLARAAQVWHLGFDELTRALDDPSLNLREEAAEREEGFQRDQARRPPLVITSEGETPVQPMDSAHLPEGAMPGTAASAGVVEGLARVVRDPDREVLHAGEILVAPFTDPGWTPLFVHAAGVVTEVGGLMTHGAVVAREYGIPAVVSVAGATERIRTGQRIRVDGTRGFVQILEAP